MEYMATVIAASSLLPVHSCSAGRGVATAMWLVQKQPLQLAPEAWGLTSLLALYMKANGWSLQSPIPLALSCSWVLNYKV